MKKFICLILLPFLAPHISAQITSQPLRIPLTKSNKIVIYSDAAIIDAEGYDGVDILVSPQKADGDTSLKKMHLLADNRDNGDSLITYQSKLTNGVNGFVFNNIKIATNCRSIKILIPNHIPLLALEFKTTSSDGRLRVKNYKGPVQIAAYFSRLEIEALTGPFSISDEYGKISVNHILWSDTARWSLYDHPYMVRSMSSDINMSVPYDLKAYFSVFIDKGKAYSDLGLGPGLIMNGGGIGISVKSSAGDIFLKRENNQ
ncbi:MAG TPA: hypothetical protein VIJ27_11175 [Mucilaginibacter sp.]